MCLCVQPFYKVTAVNPQVGSGYFSFPIMIYEGDTVSRVVDRIKRKAGTLGKKCLAIHPSTSITAKYMYCYIREFTCNFMDVQGASGQL